MISRRSNRRGKSCHNFIRYCIYTLRCAHRMVSRHLQIEEEGHATRSIHTRGSYVCVQKKRSHPSFPSV